MKDATGIQLAIPMPGHPVPDALVNATRQAVQDLSDLIDQHHVVYLLMDSRESRWLPTMLGAAKGKVWAASRKNCSHYHGTDMLCFPARDERRAWLRQLRCCQAWHAGTASSRTLGLLLVRLRNDHINQCSRLLCNVAAQTLSLLQMCGYPSYKPSQADPLSISP